MGDGWWRREKSFSFQSALAEWEALYWRRGKSFSL